MYVLIGTLLQANVTLREGQQLVGDEVLLCFILCYAFRPLGHSVNVSYWLGMGLSCIFVICFVFVVVFVN